MTELPNDPVPPAIRGILALFAGELREQRFGDLDAASLEALADEARARAREVEKARAELDRTIVALEEAREALATRARQGLAYAEIYAASDPELRAKIDALVSSEPPRTAEKRSGAPKRKPAKKVSIDASELPFPERGAA
jgi:hypothetical protein